MSAAVNPIEKITKPFEKIKDVIQYWLCLKVSSDRQDEKHVYYLDGEWYVVTGYLARSYAINMCGKEKRVAEVKVHNYTKAQLHSHKEDFSFLAWTFIGSDKTLE